MRLHLSEIASNDPWEIFKKFNNLEVKYFKNIFMSFKICSHKFKIKHTRKLAKISIYSKNRKMMQYLLNV